MSGGGGTSTSTTHTSMPSWEIPYAQNFLSNVSGQVFPGGQLGQYNPALNTQVAPFSGFQNAALDLGASQTGGTQGLASLGANTVGQYASGAMLNPQSNPALQSYYNAAALPLTQQYAYGTSPALMAQAQQAGALNSSGFNQQQGLNQYGLGQGLATLGANIYEPAYQFESGQALSAATTGVGQAQGNLFAPAQNLYGLGSAQQQQQQNQLNAGTSNAAQQANWPFALLSQLGSALGVAGGGGGTSISTGPAPGK